MPAGRTAGAAAGRRDRARRRPVPGRAAARGAHRRQEAALRDGNRARAEAIARHGAHSPAQDAAGSARPDARSSRCSSTARARAGGRGGQRSAPRRSSSTDLINAIEEDCRKEHAVYMRRRAAILKLCANPTLSGPIARPPSRSDCRMAATIELFLVRHAIAAERGPNYPDDRERPLTSEGIARFKQVVEGLKELDVELDLVLDQPARPREPHRGTAGGRRCRASREPRRSKRWRRAAGCRRCSRRSTKYAKRYRRIALVGHEPDLGELAASSCRRAARSSSRRAPSAASSSTARCRRAPAS